MNQPGYHLNPEKTLAILIGIREYMDFQNIDPAPDNVAAFAKILQDRGIFGLSRKNIKIITGGSSAEIKDKLFDYTEEANGRKFATLILYFAGHGYRRTDGKYFLIAGDSRKRHINLDGSTALSYDAIKKIIEMSRIPQSIVLLDACYSGLAVQGDNGRIEALQIKGTYTITSSDSREVSYFDTDHKYTLFTGELLKILREGLPIGEEKVSLDRLYGALSSAVKARNPNMSPQQLASKEVRGSNFYFFTNRQYDREAQKEIDGLIFLGDKKLEQCDFERAKYHYLKAEKLSEKHGLRVQYHARLNGKFEKLKEEAWIAKWWKRLAPRRARSQNPPPVSDLFP